MGALASQFWYLAFAIATAANVRTLALVEVLFAQAISRFVFGQPTSRREAAGIVLIVVGVILLIWAYRSAADQLRSSGSTGRGWNSIPSSCNSLASSGEASP